MGKIGIGTTSPTAKLEVVGSMSGRSLQMGGNQNISGTLLVLNNIYNRATYSGNILHIEKNIPASGSIIPEGTLSGATFYGAGLGDCSNATTSKVIYNPATGKFACATDQTSAGGLAFATAENIYVNQSGDTMTGALTINLSSGYLGLKVLQTASGNYIHSEKTLSSSGGLVVEGTISGSLITQNGGGNNYFLGNVGIGTTTPLAKLEVVGSMSGRSLQIAGNQNISGTLLVLNNIYNRATYSGNYLHVEKNITASGLIID